MLVYVLAFFIILYTYYMTFSVMFSQTDRFIWLDGAQWKYADWSPGKPNNGVGLENCVALLSKY